MNTSKTGRRDPAAAFTSPTPVAPILVGYDGAEGGHDALALAHLPCRARRAHCVVAIPTDGSLAEEARSPLGEEPLETVVIGVLSPARALIESAGAQHAGTLVVGSTRHSRIGRALLGSTAEQILHRAPCEVVVAPRGYAVARHESLAKVAVAVDGSLESKMALTRAEDLAPQAGASLEVLVASDPVVSGIEAEFPANAPSSLSDVLEAAIESVDPALSPAGRKVDSGWREVVRTIAQALAEACGPDVDLLATGARRPIDHFLFGSVTRHLVEQAPCPVLVVPHTRRV